MGTMYGSHAGEVVVARAVKIQDDHPSIDFKDAVNKVLDADPVLADEYSGEHLEPKSSGRQSFTESAETRVFTPETSVQEAGGKLDKKAQLMMLTDDLPYVEAFQRVLTDPDNEALVKAFSVTGAWQSGGK